MREQVFKACVKKFECQILSFLEYETLIESKNRGVCRY